LKQEQILKQRKVSFEQWLQTNSGNSDNSEKFRSMPKNKISFMNTTTFKDYKQAIKDQYKVAIEQDVSGILANPSPAQMRNLCLIICDKGLSRTDEEIFRKFFEAKEGEVLKKAINRCNIDRFKPIISFLKGTKDSNDKIRIEMAAIIVNYPHRPYGIHSKSEGCCVVGMDLDQPANLGVKVQTTDLQDNHSEIPQFGLVKSRATNKWVAVVLIAVAAISGFALSKTVFKEKECMQWQNNHYERVDCATDNQQFTSENETVPLNEKLVDFKKVEVHDTTTFFVNGKPRYWYGKVNGKPEFFNSVGNGMHPETGKALKPVSEYIIEKYVTGKK
jgi:hypothetical protein